MSAREDSLFKLKYRKDFVYFIWCHTGIHFKPFIVFFLFLIQKKYLHIFIQLK